MAYNPPIGSIYHKQKQPLGIFWDNNKLFFKVFYIFGCHRICQWSCHHRWSWWPSRILWRGRAAYGWVNSWSHPYLWICWSNASPGWELPLLGVPSKAPWLVGQDLTCQQAVHLLDPWQFTWRATLETNLFYQVF